jgi:hypothetical protein
MKTRKLLRQLYGRNRTLRDRRRGDHIGRGGRAYLPNSRMRHIRREEDVARSRARREGKEDVTFRHWNCSCGSIECQGTPVAQERLPKPVEKPKEPQISMEEFRAIRYGSP